MKTTIYTLSAPNDCYWYFNGEKWRYWNGKEWLDSLIRGFIPDALKELVTVNNFKEK